MKQTLALLAAMAALTAPAFAQNHSIAPGAPPPAPPVGTQTQNLLFQAQIAASRVATASPQNAQAAQVEYQQAQQSYQSGNITLARMQALQTIMTSNGYIAGNTPVLTAQPPTSSIPVKAFPLTEDTGKIDADYFIANARDALSYCVTNNSPQAPQAMSALNSAEAADAKGDYNTARSEAHSAVDLCASARR